MKCSVCPEDCDGSLVYVAVMPGERLDLPMCSTCFHLACNEEFEQLTARANLNDGADHSPKAAE